MINRIVIVGRLTKDPDLRYTPKGDAVARFTVAVNRTFTNAQGEREADFINCQVWRKQAENVANYLKKGSLTGVEGRLQTGSYEGQDGKRVYTTDLVADSVQFLEPKSSQDGRSESGGSQQGGQQQNRNSGQQGGYNQQGSKYNPDANKNQPNYSRVDDDPFARGSGPIDVSDDDLPF